MFCGFSPSGTGSIDASRWRLGGTLAAADFTVFVVQWGSEHHIQRVVVQGSSGGDGLDETGEWTTAAIDPVETSGSWLWASGWTEGSGADTGFLGQVLQLGSGPGAVPEVASTVAVGGESNVARKVVVTVHSHRALVVDHVHLGAGTAGTLSQTLDVTIGAETEVYSGAGSVQSTVGGRVVLPSSSVGGSSTEHAGAVWWGRATTDRTVQVSRVRGSQPWVANVQCLDAGAVRSVVAGDPQLHVTRSVLDLSDRVVQVYDARGLATPTWQFGYDWTGQRLVAEHTTGTGARYTLSDAAGNPIWSRDAVGVEHRRSFDVLGRPLLETSDDGGGAKARRQWRYVPYDATDTASQSANLFGPAEEVRDQDGLRFFAYDWRGLVTKVSHRFWAADWQSSGSVLYTDADEAAIPLGARDTLTGWLSLQGLTDPETVVVSTEYDSAARPVQEDYPQGMQRVFGYHVNGSLSQVQVDRGTGDGLQVSVQELTYNARGQQTGCVYGNGVVCTRTYDEQTERLVQLSSVQPGATPTHLQRLAYGYDPVGNPVRITDELSTEQFTSNQVVPNTRRYVYDPRYRLVRASGRRQRDATDGVDAPVLPSPAAGDYVPYTHRYAYDAVGNFQTNQEYVSGSHTLTYKAGLPDLFDGSATESYSYDANGNTTSTPRHAAMGYAHDSQPVFVDVGGGTVVRYRRHADQRTVRLVSKNGIHGLSVYLGPWEVHRRVGSSSTFTKTVLHAQTGTRVSQSEVVLSGSDPDSVPTFYVHADHLGSAQLLTGSAGQVLNQEEYFAYGRSSDRREGRSRYRYIGVERDEDTGLCMTGPRTYDPVCGRFFQGDPVLGTSTPYANTPRVTSEKDPSGFQPEVADPPPPLDPSQLTSNQQEDEATLVDIQAPGGTTRAPLVAASSGLQDLRAELSGAPAEPELTGSGKPGDPQLGSQPFVPNDPQYSQCGACVVKGLNNVGYRVGGRLTEGMHSETGLQPVNAGGSVEANAALLDALDAELASARPVALGIDHKAGTAGNDKVTDHWVYVVGRYSAVLPSTSRSGQERVVYYLIVDNAASVGERAAVNRMYVNQLSLELFKPGDDAAIMVADRRYRASNIKTVAP